MTVIRPRSTTQTVASRCDTGWNRPWHQCPRPESPSGEGTFTCLKRDSTLDQSSRIWERSGAEDSRRPDSSRRLARRGRLATVPIASAPAHGWTAGHLQQFGVCGELALSQSRPCRRSRSRAALVSSVGSFFPIPLDAATAEQAARKRAWARGSLPSGGSIVNACAQSRAEAA